MTPNPHRTPARPEAGPDTSAWPGFPFPPPLLGVSASTAKAAAAHWLREVAAMLHTGEMNLNTLFATAPAHLALREHDLSDSSLLVVTGTGMYALGAVAPTGPRTLPDLFAAPAAVHRARLLDAVHLLDAGRTTQAAGRLTSTQAEHEHVPGA